MNAKDIINACSGKLYSGNLNTEYGGFSKDTRTIKKNDVYIGIKGENFDGNRFYENAFSNGASICILEESYEKELIKTDKTIIIVKDSIEALKNLAKYYIKEKKPIVVALTGSVGKTSTRDMIYSVLSKKYKTLVTEENYNNHIGMPLTVLRLKDEELIILEMGMDNLGEIKYLSDMVKPDLAVITNVLPVHIEKLKTIDNILKAKLEITSGLKKEGTLIINNDNEYLRKNKPENINLITVGIDNNSDYTAFEVDDNGYKVKINGNTFYFDNLALTKPYISNGLLAIAAGLKLGVNISDIQSGIKDYKLTGRRLENKLSKKGVTIIDDTYNANADSMINSIEYLLKQKGNRKIAILGDINELGNYAEELHRKVGKYISDNNPDILITIGEHSKYIYEEAIHKMNTEKVIYFKTKEESYKFLLDTLQKDDIVLLKASNSNKFNEIVSFIEENC